MKSFLHRLTAPPIFDDDSKTQLAQILHYLLLMGVILGAGFTVVALPLALEKEGPLISAAMSAIFATLFWLLQRRKLRFVSLTLILSSYGAIMFSLVINGGLRDEAALTLIAVLALAGFFLGEWGTVGLGILSAIAFVALFAAERMELILETEHFSPVGGDELMIALIAVGITTVILRQLVNQIVAGSEKIRQQAKALQDKNETLLVTQQAMLAAKEEAEIANQAKSDFLSRLSHDLRTPLNSMIGFTNILLDNSSLTDEARIGWLRRIQNNGEYMQRMINDLLDLTRIEAGKLQLYPVEIPLTAFLMEVVILIQMGMQQKSFQFVYQFDEALPAYVVTDETRLRQILVNLLGNAIKFTPQGGVTFRAKPVSTTDSAQIIRFEVIDTGVGISPADLERVFEPFEQTGTNEQREKGTGLGLAISRQLVELLGGHLQAESQLGKGSRFWFDLPFSLDEKPT